jgi:phage major head subunit gpT-like protein
MPTPTLKASAAPTATPSKVSFVATAAIDLEAKAADGSKLPKFKILGYTGAAMNVFGFFTPVIVDLGGLKAESGSIPALLDHDTSQIVGQANAIDISSEGVSLEGIITGGDDPIASRVITHAKNGFRWQASIGASIVRREFLAAGEKATVNGRDVTGPLLIAREARLYEISFVALGADSQTSADVAAKVPPGSLKGAHIMFDEWLRAKGFDPSSLNEVQRTGLMASFDAEQSAPRSTTSGNGTPHSLDELLSSRRKEDDRVARITEIAAEVLNDRPVLVDEVERLARAAIDSRSSVQEFELAILRLKTRAPGSTVRSRAEIRTGRKMIEAALCLGGKLGHPEKHFDEATLESASEKFPHGLGLKDLFLMAARENGVTGLSGTDVRGMLSAAFGPAIRAEFSTISLPGILSNVANKFLVSGFDAVESSWRSIATIRNVRDFKAVTSYALTGGMIYEAVGPTGELKHATLGELGYTSQAGTYGRMFAITRTDIINDDLGALTTIPQKLGRGAALKLNLVFWTAFLADLNTFYTSGRGNVSTGAGSALSSAGLAAAHTKFAKQTDPDGLPLATMPKILLVPPELEVTANQLMTSLIINTGGAATDTQVPNANVWANKYRTVVSSYLSNSSITGYSTAAWWLIADPQELPLIEVAFLNGRETPTVESADADFNILGVQMRGYHDFGVAKQEYRAAVRSAGS